jgi:hypothetical protein
MSPRPKAAWAVRMVSVSVVGKVGLPRVDGREGFAVRRDPDHPP